MGPLIKSLRDFIVAGGRGFEPRLMGPEPIVLPLNDPPVSVFLAKFSWKVKGKHNLTAKEGNWAVRSLKGVDFYIKVFEMLFIKTSGLRSFLKIEK